MTYSDQQRRIRKQPLATPTERATGREDIDLVAIATLSYTSEDPDHPVEHVVDESAGPGGTRWIAATPNTTETLLVSFDEPQTISRIVYEVEEPGGDRTQEIRIATSSDGGKTFRDVLNQEYNFSPSGATFQHEDLRVSLANVTDLRLMIVPNKRGSGRATLTTLRLYP